MTQKELQQMFANPFYCLKEVDPIFIMKHEPLVSEKEWIKSGAKVIDEIGAEKFLKMVLENLKGNYVTA